MFFRLFFLACVSSGTGFAAPMSLPQEMFRSDDFKKAFVGSYGFLAPAEPKVSRAESEMLVTVRELFDQKQFRRAESLLAKYIRDNDGKTDAEGNELNVSPAMVYVLGKLYMQADKLDDARRAMLEAIRRYPRFRRAHLDLAYVFAKSEDMEKAMPHLQQAIELGENSHRAFGLLGFGYLDSGNAVAAETAYRKAIMLNAEAQDWQNGLAQALIAQEKFEEAASLLGVLVEASPNNRDLYLQQTKALIQLEKMQDAATTLEVLRMRGLAQESDLTLLGNLYIGQKQSQLALLAYLSAIDMAATIDIDRAMKSARILNDNGFSDQAAALVAKVRAKLGDEMDNKTRVELLLVDLKIANNSNNLSRAGVILEDLLRYAAANGEVHLEKGKYHQALAEQSDDEDLRKAESARARTHYQIAADKEDTAYAGNLALGQLYTNDQRFIDALPHLKRALDLRASDGLRDWVRKVQRAADRQQQRQEAEQKAKEDAA